MLAGYQILRIYAFPWIRVRSLAPTGNTFDAVRILTPIQYLLLDWVQGSPFRLFLSLIGCEFEIEVAQVPRA